MLPASTLGVPDDAVFVAGGAALVGVAGIVMEVSVAVIGVEVGIGMGVGSDEPQAESTMTSSRPAIAVRTNSGWVRSGNNLNGLPPRGLVI
jgi:hypothetical protein